MAESRNNTSCCVPQCTNSKKKQPYLSFHSFPTSRNLRTRWIHSIRRQEGVYFSVRRGSSFVCALHFAESEVLAHRESGRKYLQAQAVPSRFAWNNWGRKEWKMVASRGNCRREVTLGSQVDVENQIEPMLAVPAAVMQDHDYCCLPSTGALDDVLDSIKELEEIVLHLTCCGPLLNRWCTSDEDFRHLTRFPSQQVFCIFWRSIEPSALKLEYWSKARRVGFETIEGGDIISPSPTRQLHLIDEFFMYCLRVAAGLLEVVLAAMFEVSTSTVSSIVTTWSHYLYLVLGSAPIWMRREQVRRRMPEEVQLYNPNMRVIIDCTEIRCENPEAFPLHSETFPLYKSNTTLKALIGVAPCGEITFVSKLFTGSISDQNLTKHSGLLCLLEPGDEVMADNTFLIKKLLENVGAKLVIPPFKHNGQLSKDETVKTQALPKLRILVEHALRRVKEYRIWDTPIPLTLVSTINQIWSNCCVMVNFQNLALDSKVKVFRKKKVRH